MYFSSILAATAVVLSFSPCILAAPHVTRATACNNSPDLCNRNYNNITHLGAHDVAFLRDSTTSFSTSGNQFYNATVALSAGVRLLQAQMHDKDGVIELCHTSCELLDGGTLEAFLKDIKSWMDANTNEVVTLLLVNSDDNSTASIGSVFSSSGIDTYGFSPSSSSGPLATWPTLQTLITANTRLVTFIASLQTTDATYPYLLNEFDYVFETAFGVTSLSGFNCTLDRPSTQTSAAAAIASGFMSLQNHFVDTSGLIQVPDVTNIEKTNSPSTNSTGAVGTELARCAEEWGSNPVFVLVDFWNVESPIEAVDNINKISPTGRTNVSDAILTQASSNGVKAMVERLTPGGATTMALVSLVGINFMWL